MLIYLDACAIIEAREKFTPAGQSIANLMIDAFNGDTLLRTCELSLLEVLVRPLHDIESPDAQIRSESGALRDWYTRNLVSDGLFLKTSAIDAETLRTAAWLRATASRDHSGSLKAPDAIHFASAVLAGCSHFVTGDERLSNAIARHVEGSRIEIVALDDAAIDELAKRITS
ncbi:type II toxin-antitoxin system VapC family toxin [Bosea sp. (in: a-proteobacteria)]|uniref:type II toxin-antitoxin system VapC family toxin n=1 Tax=Bosea sp. (in: a-proteobacteria) TaxID=1871050 RepID=UPI003B3A2C66